MKRACKELSELLVDYVDGELDSNIAAEVGEHLKQCPSCQKKAMALDRSLHIAQSIWCQTEVRPENMGSDPILRWHRYAAAAAAMLVVGVAAFLWSLQSRPAPTFDQMEDSIAQAASAARILAAADILAAQDGGKQAARGQYLLVAQTYKNTPSGKEVLSRMKSTERRI